MTEVPEHLLRRSRERREALGLAGGGAPAQPAEGAAPAPAEAAPTPPAPSEEGAAAPAVVEEAAPPAIPEPPNPIYVAAEAAARTRIPMWVMPVLAVLPFWGVLYIGAFGDRTAEEPLTGVALGAQVYRSAGCGACHGSAGEGAVGPALAGGESTKTFPTEQDHINWVRTGSASFAGKPYGDPNREGGQRGPATGGMPGFANLSDEEVEAVVKYEREEL